MKKTSLTISAIIIIVVCAVLVGGVTFWQYLRVPKEKKMISEIEGKDPIAFFAVLEVEEVEDKGIAFLQNGNIWVLNKSLKKKSKLIDIKEEIVSFSFSPDGKEIYWQNGKGELWKRNKEDQIRPLVTVEKDMKEEIQETWGEEEPFSYLQGKVMTFQLSPDGNYIAYKTLEGYMGCCMGPFDIPVGEIQIMKNNGIEKVIVESPPGILRERIFFDGWLPDSKKILFHFQSADEPTSGSPFFEVDIDGKNPKIYTEIFKFFKEGVEITSENFTLEDIAFLSMDVVTTKPVYSPSGEKVVYIKDWDELRLKDLTTQVTETILDLKDNFVFDLPKRLIIWAEDSSLLVFRGRQKISVLNKEGEMLFETEFKDKEVDFPPYPSRIMGILSPDNKYLGGIYLDQKEETETIFLTNLDTRETKEFQLTGLEEYSDKDYIYPQFFQEGNKFCYIVGEAKEKTPDDRDIWVIDLNAWNNYKVVENVSHVIRVP
jgi:Tol biopolymer transport system component